MGGVTEQWQDEVWAFYDTCPEFGNAVMFSGNSMAKVRLFPAVFENDDDDGVPIPASDPAATIPPELATAARDALRDLKSPIGGQAEILRVLAMNLEAPGESYLVYLGAREPSQEQIDLAAQAGDPPPQAMPARWEVLSLSEIDVKDAGTYVKIDGAGPKGMLLDSDKGDDLFRVWLRHPRWSTRADSSARHCLPVMRTLQGLTWQVDASTNSQMHSGILFLSNGMTFAGQQVTPVANEEHAQSPFEEALDESFVVPIETGGDDISTIRPMVVFGSKEDIAASKYMTMSRVLDEQMDARIEAQVTRLARGLNLPVEVVTGMMATTFANGEQIDQQTFDDYLEPRCRLIVDALTVGYLRPLLLEQHPEQAAAIERIVVWYDPQDLLGKPDQVPHATEGVKIGALGRAGWRRTMGYDDSDAPEPGEEPPAASMVPIGGSAVTASAGRSRGALGHRLTEIDRRLYDRLSVAFSMAIERALERAGARLRAKAQGTQLRDLTASVPNGELTRRLGPAIVADAVGDEDLLAGAWVGLEPVFRQNVQLAQRQAREAAAARLPIGDVTATQAEDLDEAWGWAAAALTDVTQRSMFEDIALATIGEANPAMRSPAGLVRQAMARAGGTRGIEPRGMDRGYVTTLAGTDNPAGGVATGTTIMDAATDAGATVDGFTWVWGDADRPFDPHLDLDGTTYTNYDDPTLDNGEDFPPFPHYFPGDHLGCTCTAEPSLLGPDGEPI